MILRKNLLCSTRAICGCCKWDLDFLSMLRFCLLIHTFREFRRKNFQEKTIIGGLDWQLTILTIPFCNQVLLGRFLWKPKVPQFWPPFWSPTEFRYPQQNFTSCFEAKYLAMTQALSPGCNPEKRIIGQSETAAAFFPTQTLNDYIYDYMVYLAIIYHTNQLTM